MNKLLLIDTFNFLHRAYHALPTSFRDERGEPTNAVYGVTSMVINILDQIKPTYVLAAMDSIEPTFRLEDFTAYKAHRKPMEEDLSSQIPKVIEMLDAFGIKQVMVNGYEADDIIATTVANYKDDNEIVVVSNDRDLWQLVDKNVLIMLPSTKGSAEWLGPKEVTSRFGFEPGKIADYKGLRGDTSDNIPGVFGIGEKTAASLVKEFGSVEDIYNNIDKVKPDSLRQKLLNSYEQAMMSKKLAQLIYDVPIAVELDDLRYSTFNKINVKKVLERYNFKSLIRRLGFENENNKTSKSEVSKDQLSLL
ncbi:hypothetical protein A2415_04985 [candidate division WWE3 bacterium RIFOXYC1_FULL_39_7]|uniref:5'-3' exonuclease domain-containing protein n=2 Tax=Katanobacteria TaxID=422282 RepID=A0A1F4X5C4_UNCKA|nr:MAG: hypothetical protein A2415_04985 [candidate division WWE3 bacterium RIFOXYC1_FULL_39_7]OGC76890.1 MAG: hypothetical protein A2619_02495 [candidate division WWE3 bacterium RIFOXYD1_FULL_39_9]